MFLKPTAGPGNGIFPGSWDATVTATEALTKGDTAQFDLADTAATSKVPGATNAAGADISYFNTVRNPDTNAEEDENQLKHGFFCVATEGISAAATGVVRVWGEVNANTATGAVAGSGLCPATDGQLDLATGALALKIIAIALEAPTSNLADVLLSGIFPFGVDAA